MEKKGLERALKVQREWLAMAQERGQDKLVTMLEETIARNELMLKERI